jgi:hypothetical protein
MMLLDLALFFALSIVAYILGVQVIIAAEYSLLMQALE